MGGPDDDRDSDWAGPRSAPSPGPAGMPPPKRPRRGCLFWVIVALVMGAVALAGIWLSGELAGNLIGTIDSSLSDGAAPGDNGAGDWGGPRMDQD